jgi:hypothetical protein
VCLLRGAAVYTCIGLIRSCLALATDPKTRKEWAKFSQLVDRTLQSFDSVSEWADFITFLGKLLKVRCSRVPVIVKAS